MVDQCGDADLPTRIALDANDFSRAIDANALRHSDFGRKRKGKLDWRVVFERFMIGENEHPFSADIASCGDCMEPFELHLHRQLHGETAH